VTVRQPVDVTAVRDGIHLEPATPGTVSVNGSDVLFTPGRQLAASTRYTLVVPAGVREQSGTTTRHDIRLTFTTRDARLAVLRGEAHAHTIWAVDPTDGSEQQLTDPADDVVVATPSPDGNELAYITQPAADHWDLRIVRTGDAQSRTVLTNQSGAVARIVWSPHGDLIAAEVRDVFGSTASPSRIFVIPTDGSQTALVYGRGTQTGSMPAWSPDGNQLAFHDALQSQLVLFNFTSTLRTVRSSAAAMPSWAPDSHAFAFADRAADDAPQMVVKVAHLTDSAATVSPITAGPDDTDPAWSPTGDTIAFTRRASSRNQEVWLTRSDGSEAHLLYAAPDQLYISPVWSPDGTQLAVTRVPFDSSWLIDLSSGTAHQVTQGRALAWLG
jgi:Tol biopolymer transport system component